MDIKCPVCGSICLPGEKFCQNCGTRLPEIAPAAPAYAPPAQTYEQPAAPAYEAPAQPEPAYEQPAAPAYEAPAQPEPVYEQPAAPAYEAPAQPEPVYEQPAAPAYEAPAQPAYEQPAYAPNPAYNYAAQAYGAPVPAPEKPKKKKTGLIVTLCIVGVLIAALVASYFFLFTPNSVTLSSEAETLETYDTVQLTAKVNPGTAFLSKGITWTSSDENIASVDETGLVYTWGNPGTCEITATTGNGKSATCTVTVEVPPSLLFLSEYMVELEAGKSITLEPEVYPENASGYTITWTSSDPFVATVADGKVTAVADGECTITATISDDIKATCDVTVGVAVSSLYLSEYWADLKVGDTLTLEPEVYPENATNYTITWTSDDNSVAIVSDGKITAVGKGECTIRAAISDDVYSECYVSVTDAIAASEYDSYILGDWRLTLIYDYETEIDSPVSDYGLTGSITFYSDHTARMTINNDSADLTWAFEELDDYAGISRYSFRLDFDDSDYSYYYFDYIVDAGEIWLYVDDVDNGYTYTYER